MNREVVTVMVDVHTHYGSSCRRPARRTAPNLMKFAKLTKYLQRAMPLQIDIRAGGEVHYLRFGI